MTSGLLLGEATLRRVQAASERVSDRSPQEVASDETFWRDIQQCFSVSRSVVNLNNAGVCPCPRIVTEAVEYYTREQEKVPPYTAFTTLPPQLETIRASLARLFGCDPEEIALTRNTTESLQTVLLGVSLEEGDEVLTTTQDYWAMLDALEQRRLRGRIRVNKIRVPTPPRNLEELAEVIEGAITAKTRLILVSHPVNLTGQHFPVKRICEIAHARGIEVVVDGAQSFGLLDYSHADLDCDYFGTSLHKWLMAPKGTGMLYVRRDKIGKVWPLLPAPEKLREDVRKFEMIGTQPATPLAIGEAVAFHNGVGAKRKEERLRYLTHYWAKRLERLPNVRFHTSFAPEMSSAIATVEVVGVDAVKLTDYLWDRRRILVTNPARRTTEFQGIRVSPSLHTTLEELDYFCEVMEDVSRRGLPAAA